MELKDLKVGDEVAIVTHFGGTRVNSIAKITKETKLHFEVDNTKYRKDTGRQVGAAWDRDWDASSICIITDEILKNIEYSTQYRKCMTLIDKLEGRIKSIDFPEVEYIKKTNSILSELLEKR